MVEDMRGRPLRDLRISLTDRCNMRCRYCMPREHFAENHEFLNKTEILSYEEIASIVNSMVPLGLEKVRLTGGEPLLRRDIDKLVKQLPSELDLALTTNGLLLERYAEILFDSGLDRVTVSLDAIDEETFQKMGDTKESPSRVLKGIEKALSVGLKVKVNSVIRKGVNTHSIKEISDYFVNSDVIVRFIEYMDVGETNSWNLDEVVSGEEMREILAPLSTIEQNYTGEVANRYSRGNQELGFIESVSKPFCHSCNRARLSADGKIYTCLFANNGNDLKSLLRMGASAEDIRTAISSIWKNRDDAYSENRGKMEHSKVEMSYIGG